MRPVNWIIAALLLGSVACGFSKFDDFETKAPVVKVGAGGSISSATFGDALVALPFVQAAETQDGAQVVGSANAPAAITTVTFGPSGSVTANQIDGEDLNEHLEQPDRIESLARGPDSPPVGAFNGPFVYVGFTKGPTGGVRTVDVNEWGRVDPLTPPPVTANIQNFGASVAGANLDGTADDLVVGALGKLVLLPARDNRWPEFKAWTEARIITGGPAGVLWPTQDKIATIATGQLDPASPTDEIAFGVPEKNFVGIVYDTPGCLAADPCTNVIQVPVPDGAIRFGASLQIGDADGNGTQDLVVGAPDASRVYVYRDFTAVKFDGTQTTLAVDPTVISPPTPSPGFGASLALGRFGGQEAGILLAIGAPSSDVGSTPTAGRILLFNVSQNAPAGDPLELASPSEGGLLGRSLVSMPFSVDGTVHDVLVAAGRAELYTFFAFTTPQHQDVRKR